LKTSSKERPDVKIGNFLKEQEKENFSDNANKFDPTLSLLGTSHSVKRRLQSAASSGMPIRLQGAFGAYLNQQDR
jgi:hypothetical protein